MSGEILGFRGSSVLNAVSVMLIGHPGLTRPGIDYLMHSNAGKASCLCEDVIL